MGYRTATITHSNRQTWIQIKHYQRCSHFWATGWSSLKLDTADFFQVCTAVFFHALFSGVYCWVFICVLQDCCVYCSVFRWVLQFFTVFSGVYCCVFRHGLQCFQVCTAVFSCVYCSVFMQCFVTVRVIECSTHRWCLLLFCGECLLPSGGYFWKQQNLKINCKVILWLPMCTI